MTSCVQCDIKSKMATDDVKSNFLQHELDISTKMTNLEKKAGELEKDFNEMLFAAREMERAVKRYVKRAEAEQRSWEILEKITETDINVCDIIDHVRIFFNFVLAKMKVHNADVTDVKMLWQLIDCEGVSQCFNDVIIQCGFTRSDVDHMRTLVSVVAKMQEDLEGQGITDELVDKLICHTEQLLELENVSGTPVEVEHTLECDNGGVEKVGITAFKDETKRTSFLNEAFINDADEPTVDTLNLLEPLTDPVKEIADVEIDFEEKKDAKTIKKVKLMTEGMGDDETVKSFDNSVRDHVGPIRDVLKRIHFLDVGDELRELIKNIVRYVTKIMHE